MSGGQILMGLGKPRPNFKLQRIEARQDGERRRHSQAWVVSLLLNMTSLLQEEGEMDYGLHLMPQVTFQGSEEFIAVCHIVSW